jgi:heme-degrading monooxygenase HmoA
MKVATFVKALVPENRREQFESGYRSLRKESTAFPPGLERSFLLKDTKIPGMYTIQTIWTSRELLEAMRSSGTKPKALELFEKVGATPQLEIHEIVQILP